jgi:hypothetical protein
MKKLVLLAAFIFAASFCATNAQTVNKKIEKTEKAASVQKEKATKAQATVKNMKSKPSAACEKIDTEAKYKAALAKYDKDLKEGKITKAQYKEAVAKCKNDYKCTKEGVKTKAKEGKKEAIDAKKEVKKSIKK